MPGHPRVAPPPDVSAALSPAPPRLPPRGHCRCPFRRVSHLRPARAPLVLTPLQRLHSTRYLGTNTVVFPFVRSVLITNHTGRSLVATTHESDTRKYPGLSGWLVTSGVVMGQRPQQVTGAWGCGRGGTGDRSSPCTNDGRRPWRTEGADLKPLYKGADRQGPAVPGSSPCGREPQGGAREMLTRVERPLPVGRSGGG